MRMEEELRVSPGRGKGLVRVSEAMAVMIGGKTNVD